MKAYWQTKRSGDAAYKGELTYQTIATDMGRLFVAETAKGVCQLGFVVPAREQEPLNRLKKNWPQAKLIEGETRIAAAKSLEDLWRSNPSLHLYGTAFQLQVWRKLMEIASGSTSTYGSIARQIAKPRACRAVGTAVGANPIAILVPCHRVLGGDGRVGNYHWGPAIKQALLDAEQAGYLAA